MKKLTITAFFLLPLFVFGQKKSTKKRQSTEDVYLIEGGEISKHYTRCQLVQVKRNMQGFKHLFVSDNGDTLYRTMQRRLIVDSCYLVFNAKR